MERHPERRDASPPIAKAVIATAKKQAEKALRLLVERLPDGVLVSCKGRVAFANPAAMKILGAKRLEELLGKAAMELIQPQARERVQRVIRGKKVD